MNETILSNATANSASVKLETFQEEHLLIESVR